MLLATSLAAAQGIAALSGSDVAFPSWTASLHYEKETSYTRLL